jgi:NAD(P)-dependent dehydrogenase (short-subunit alcohol dehydrogenase family)
MAGRLSGKVCIITGSGGSMGRAAAILFASEGARVIGCDVNTESALETLRLVKASQGDMASMQPCDLTDAKQCQALVDFAVSTYGRIDVLFNNAAMAYFGWIDQMADEDWYKTITQELHLVFLLTKAAWPELARHGGSIINTASVSARLGFKVLPGLAHAAAKGAIVSLTRHMAMEGSEQCLPRSHQNQPDATPSGGSDMVRVDARQDHAGTGGPSGRDRPCRAFLRFR